MTTLTPGTIHRIFVLGEVGLEAVVQVLEIHETGKNRWKARFSDGESSAFFMITSAASQLFTSSAVRTFTVVRLKEYQLNTMSGRKIAIATNVDVLSHNNAQFGFPTALDTEADGGDNAYGGGVEQQQQQQQQHYAQPHGGSAAPAAPPVAPPAVAGGYGGGGAGYGGGGGGAGGGAAYGGTGAVVRATPGPAGQTTMKVADLNPYVNRWNIKVRVTSKGDIKTWQNDRGAGSLFKVDLLDEHGGEISAAFFKDAVTKFHKDIAVGSVYYMSGGRVKVADKRYSNGREYEINFDEKATITPAADEGVIKTAQFNLVPISSIATREPNAIVDVMGIIHTIGESVNITSKAGKNLTKREVNIFDESCMSIDITLWGDTAKGLTATPGQVLAMKCAKISDWNSRSLGSLNSSVLEVEPQSDAAHTMRGWYAANPGVNIEALSVRSGGGGGGGGSREDVWDIAKRRVLSQLREDSIISGQLSPEDFHSLRVSIDFMKRDPEKMWYPACTGIREGRTCNKKLVDQGGGSWNCDICYAQVPEYRYILNVRLLDHTGSTLATLFNDQAAQLLGISANDLHKQLVEQLNSDASAPEFESHFKAHVFKEFLVTAKCKMEAVRDEQRLKTTVIRLAPIEGAGVVKEIRALTSAIKKMMTS